MSTSECVSVCVRGNGGVFAFVSMCREVCVCVCMCGGRCVCLSKPYMCLVEVCVCVWR